MACFLRNFCEIFGKSDIFGKKYLPLYYRYYITKVQTMKKLFSWMVAAVLCGGFVACDKNDDATSQTIDNLLGEWSLVEYKIDNKVVTLEDENRTVEIRFETLGKGMHREKARDNYGQWYDETMALDWNFTGSRLTTRRLDGERKSGVVTMIDETAFMLDCGDGYVEHFVRK